MYRKCNAHIRASPEKKFSEVPFLLWILHGKYAILNTKTDRKEGSVVKKIETIHAVGHVLCHDVTQIIKDKTKGPVFREGHIVTEEDIPEFLAELGKTVAESGMDFNTWNEKHPGGIEAVAALYLR